MAAMCLDMRRARKNDLRSRNASSHPSGSGHHPSDYAEEEKQRRRHEWMLEQEKKREHERRKQIMIQQYEARRAHELALRNAHRSSHRARTRSQSRSRSFSSSRSRERKRTPSRSRSRNKSTRNRDRSRSRSSRSRSSDHSRKQRVRCNVSKTLVMAKSAPVFKGPEISPIPLADLKKIKIDIHRQIPTTVPQPEKLERDILNPEDIVVARKDDFESTLDDNWKINMLKTLRFCY
ncbi:GSCOCT00001338001.2-RD-CDS [Cotesia congregata]|uniref:Transformer n=1 Tax=Cotesia congregata TaxID=51543 RepID=A0A8J2HJE9_COTCN|nr:GSCOCT00001338001.2-RD-CDS [Cotesia congregata]CAG5097187.1 transformer [Cotesia congregata]